MTRPSIAIRSAASHEMPATIATIVAAFLTDPPARFAWSSAHEYLRAMPLATGKFVGCCFEHGSAYVSADLCGAALWLPPGVGPDGEAVEKVFRDTAKREHLDDLLATFEKMAQSHPGEEHWYLAQIGVDPNAQGRGVGAALMAHAVARCDQERALAYLEASKQDNVAFYQRYGFEVTGRIQVGAAPAVVPMVRRPR